MGLGLGQALNLASTTLTPGRGGGYDADAEALFSRLTVPPSAPQKAAYNALILGLKADGLWALTDRLLIYGVHDAQAARQNIRQNLYNAVAVAAPNFLAFNGYAGDGAASYLNTGYAPGVSAGVASRDSNAAMIWSLTESLASTTECGNSVVSIGARIAGGQSSSRNMNTVGSNDAVASSAGCFVVSRTGSSSYRKFFNGVAFASPIQTSTAPTTDVSYDCARNFNGVLTTPSSRRIYASAHLGGLSDSQVVAFYTRINAFRSAFGP